MDSNTTLACYREGLYACFERAGDALMNIVDALLTQTHAQSLPELSLSPFFTRRWPSLYQGLQRAHIDREALQRLWARHAPAPLLLGMDASSIARPHSPTARDRTYVHQSNLPEGTKPTLAGWQFSTLSVLPPTTSSWTYVLDNQRIQSDQTQGQTATRQLEQVVPLLPLRPLILGDGYYGSARFVSGTAALPCDFLLRFASNRVLYRAAPAPTGRRGAPKKDGAPLRCADPATHGAPDAAFTGHDAKGQSLEVRVWQQLHFKQCRHVTVSVLCVVRQAAAGTKRDPRTSWFLFIGRTLPALPQIPSLYARRYSLEHAYRVDKQDLLWAAVRLRTPEQMQHWTDMVCSVRNQLVLASKSGVAFRQPWERQSRPATPQQVRRGMGPIIAGLGTPARAPRVRGKSAGRRLGQVVAPAQRFKVVYKAAQKTKQIV